MAAAERGTAALNVTGPGRMQGEPRLEAPSVATVAVVEAHSEGPGGAGGPELLEASEAGGDIISAGAEQPGVEINVSDTLVSNSVAVDVAKAEARLDKLEEVVSLDDTEGDICWMYDEEVGIEARVHRTLRDNVLFWHKSGASQFALSVIQNGYILELSEDIEFY